MINVQKRRENFGHQASQYISYLGIDAGFQIKKPRGYRGLLNDFRFCCYNEPERSLLALNLATFLALILMVSPLKGLRPVRAALLETEKVPKPTKVSLSPLFKVLVTPSWKESRAAAAATLVMPASSAILLINSALFILN